MPILVCFLCASVHSWCTGVSGWSSLHKQLDWHEITMCTMYPQQCLLLVEKHEKKRRSWGVKTMKVVTFWFVTCQKFRKTCEFYFHFSLKNRYFSVCSGHFDQQ
jgi:hypothetical protein